MKKHFKKLITMLLVIALLVPTVAMISTNAVDGDPVELAFNNLFIFEKWATNKLSTTVQVATGSAISTEGATLTTDITNGSFTLAKTCTTNSEVYTAFSMGSNFADNDIYYMADVKPNTSYNFFYNLSGNVTTFTPYVFMYSSSGAYETMAFSSTSTLGDNCFTFTTGSDTAYIQVRFTINATTATSTATVKNINIYRFETSAIGNIFDFDSWATNAKSSAVDSTYGYNDGTITPDTNTDSIRFETNTNSSITSNMLFSGFSLSSNAGYYNIDVEPNRMYTLYYDVGEYNASTNNALNFEPWIVYNREDGSFIKYTKYVTPGYGANSYTFVTDADTSYISIVFAIEFGTNPNDKWYITVSDISLCQAVEYKNDPHRQVYTEGAGNYTDLPVPTDIPEGKVFAGWYTGEDGTGKLITSDTKISYESYTVYPKYETKLDDGGLKIANPATKLTYTLGEKVNTAGLVLEATVTTDGGTNVYKVNSGYRYSPETVATTPGTQTITVTYGGQSVSYDVTVIDSLTESVKINGVATDVAVTNNEYFINLTGTDFNRYEITYYSDAYVKAILNTTATDGTTVSEEFFLEPSTNGDFVSFIDGFLDSTIYTNISSISFEPLNKDFFTFELYSVETILATMPTDNMQYQQDDTHKVGIDLSMGGALAYLEELSGNVVASYYGEGQAAQVDYKSMISGGTQISEGVNLINRHDPGRFVQQSYYGTREDPYVTGDYNGVEWNYNPVQGGNYKFESSKIIDYRITSNEIYVKARPLDWGKYSDEFANSKEGDFVDNNGNGVWDEDQGELMLEPRYGDEYITDSYMEAWYVFEDDMVKTYCRFVDFSGYPANTTTQELPAFYPVEPLNTFAYYEGETVWEEEPKFDFANANKENEPDFWGVSPNYNTMLKTNNLPTINPKVDNPENWAAFMGSDDENSFGIGIYSAGVTEFHYGTYPQIRVEPEVKNGVLNTNLTSTQFNNADMYENGVVTMPDMQDATSYIAPVGTMTFESYKPYSYSYYIASGTLHDIREDFRRAKSDDEAAAVAGADIAVPETSYMKPAEGASKIGQYYVNNILNANNNYTIQTVAEATDAMSFGVHINGATKFTVDVVNVTIPSDDIDLYDSNGNEVANTQEFALGEHTGFAVFDEGYYLAFNNTGLNYGDKATAKWVITGYDSSGNVVGTYTAYTVLYASERTIGAVAEARATSTYNSEISSWITGANGINHSQLAPFGSYQGDIHDSGTFKFDPLVYNESYLPAGSSQTSNDYINTDYPSSAGDGGANEADDYSTKAYVMQTATDGPDHSRALSYLGLLKIDKSRYTNTNQIPNLKIGYDVLRVNDSKKDSLVSYDTFYTLGTSDSYIPSSVSESPSGWTQYSSYYEIAADSTKTIPYRETVVPAYAVTDDIDGKYIHALNQGRSYETLAGYKYAAAGSSLLISLTDKSGLRDSVMEGYTLPEEKYSEDSYNKFLDKLEDAATVLGDPSASQESIDQAQKELDEVKDQLVNVYYSLKYDNLFSAYEFSQHSNSMTVVGNRGTVSYNEGALTVVNDTITGGEAYTNYGTAEGNYLISLTPNTEYVFEYTSETTLKAQAFMFFYNSNGGAGDVPTNMSIKVNDGNWSSKSESNAWWGNYQNGAGTNHYVIKFTTGANTYKAGFRFGNTSNDPCESTFSNIKLIDAAHYYEDATYSKTEDVYKEHASYGTLVTPVRPGFTFLGWVDADGNTVTGENIATENKTIYSTWSEHTYTIIYKPNGGTGSERSREYDYTEAVTLDSGDGFAKSGFDLIGWSTKSDATEAEYKLSQTGLSGLSAEANGTVTLYAVWASARYNVTFDNMFDFDAFNISTNELTINEKTDTGFTVTSTGEDANTDFSYAITVEPGKTYILSADTAFVPSGSNSFDMYVQALNANGAGDATFKADSSVSVESGCYMVKHGTASTNNISIKFTAGASTTQIKIRFDANDSGNKLTVNNIRFYEDTGITVSPVNKYVSKDSNYGTLPTPTRAGYTFQGWYDGNNLVTESTEFTKTSTVYLTSKWVINDTALTADTVVIDFATPVKFMPLANDTILASASGTKTLLGFSKDGGTSYTATLAGTYGNFSFSGTEVTYTPSKVINGTDEVYYYVSDGTTTIKSKITIVPASNVLYEDTMFVAGSGTTGVEWKSAGGTALDLSTSDDGIYGYDTSYISDSQYSNNTALTATIDSDTKRSRIMTFTFTGTGFDLYSACGATTGVQIVTVKSNKTGKVVNATVVDTYYNDTSYGTLYQVPIVSITDLDHGSYTVQVAATYISNSGAVNNALSSQSVSGIDVYSATADNAAVREMLANAGMEYVLDAEEVNVVWFDDDSVFNGGKGVETQADGTVSTASTTVTLLNVIDSIRIYNPIVNGDAYYNTNEAGAQYYNVIDNLMNGGSITAESLFAYVSGNANSQITIDNYNSIGPKDEIYLANATTKAITFTVGNVNADTRVMISLRAAYGTPTAKIGDEYDRIPAKTEMYYDITDYIDKATGTVTIQNISTDASLLAIGYVKVTGATATLLNTFDLETASAMMAAPAKEVDFNAPVTEPDATTPEEDTSTPEEDAGADDSSDATESWLTRLINYIVELVKKIVSFTKSLFASVTSLLSF